jgi:hypothetical protein
MNKIIRWSSDNSLRFESRSFSIAEVVGWGFPEFLKEIESNAGQVKQLSFPEAVRMVCLLLIRLAIEAENEQISYSDRIAFVEPAVFVYDCMPFAFSVFEYFWSNDGPSVLVFVGTYWEGPLAGQILQSCIHGTAGTRRGKEGTFVSSSLEFPQTLPARSDRSCPGHPIAFWIKAWIVRRDIVLSGKFIQFLNKSSKSRHHVSNSLSVLKIIQELEWQKVTRRLSLSGKASQHSVWVQ